ncbi:MAG: riboflavin synthase [Thermodesulfovibrionaceae bacterium]
MFTGIILEVGKVFSIQSVSQGAKLWILSEKIIKETAVGDSISVNGVCLTVSEIDREKKIFKFDVSYETLKKTNLGELKRGDFVNLEPALTLNKKLGGHLVTGHVEGVGLIKRVEKIGEYIKIEIECPKEILRYCIPKGSIAVDGISLTVVDVLSDSFTVVIIPHTAKMTTIGAKKVGDKVNLESDIIAKYVEKLLKRYEEEDSLMKKLERYGFI